MKQREIIFEGNIQKIVMELLSEFPETRDNNQLLVAKVWRSYFEKNNMDIFLMPTTEFLKIYSQNKLPSADSITRASRSLQAEFEELQTEEWAKRQKFAKQVADKSKKLFKTKEDREEARSKIKVIIEKVKKDKLIKDLLQNKFKSIIEKDLTIECAYYYQNGIITNEYVFKEFKKDNELKYFQDAEILVHFRNNDFVIESNNELISYHGNSIFEPIFYIIIKNKDVSIPNILAVLDEVFESLKLKLSITEI